MSIARDLTERLEAEERAHAAERQVAVLEDRQRIARDLHDLVIQRLFASGLGLSAMATSAADPSMSDRLNEVINDLDDTIRQLRSSIFDLARSGPTTALRATVIDVCRRERGALGLDPALHFDGPVDLVTDDQVEHVAAVLAEALSNTARHARATAVVVSVTVADELVLRVADNGIGLRSDIEHVGNGIENMAARAVALGGLCTVGAAANGGTEVVWRIPLA